MLVRKFILYGVELVLSCWRISLLLLNSYSIPACPAAHAVPALVLDVPLSRARHGKGSKESKGEERSFSHAHNLLQNTQNPKMKNIECEN